MGNVERVVKERCKLKDKKEETQMKQELHHYCGTVQHYINKGYDEYVAEMFASWKRRYNWNPHKK